MYTEHLRSHSIHSDDLGCWHGWDPFRFPHCFHLLLCCKWTIVVNIFLCKAWFTWMRFKHAIDAASQSSDWTHALTHYCPFQKKKAVNLLARLHGNVCLVLTKSKVLNDKKMN